MDVSAEKFKTSDEEKAELEKELSDAKAIRSVQEDIKQLVKGFRVRRRRELPLSSCSFKSNHPRGTPVKIRAATAVAKANGAKAKRHIIGLTALKDWLKSEARVDVE
ncbi:MAG: hypothetical protein Q9174_007169 [Haloplaca sp. 1 TL-2023]